MTEPRPAPALHAPTVMAMAIVAYCLTNLLHEGLGHGAACVLGGGRPEMLNAIFFSCDTGGMGSGGRRWLAAVGSLANLAAAGALLLLPAVRRPVGARGYFAWLLLALNVLMPFGYLLFSGVAGFGDWAEVVAGLRPAAAFRAGLTALGAALYFGLASWLLMPGLGRYVGHGPERAQRVFKLALLPYLTGGITFLLAGLRNPVGAEVVLSSAVAASFGGMSWLAWYPQLVRGGEGGPQEGVPRSPGWMAAGVVTFCVFVGLLGPGVKL